MTIAALLLVGLLQSICCSQPTSGFLASELPQTAYQGLKQRDLMVECG